MPNWMLSGKGGLRECRGCGSDEEPCGLKDEKGVTVLFPHHSILLFFHTRCLLTWRGRRLYTNTSYLFIRTYSSFCFFDLSTDLANF